MVTSWFHHILFRTTLFKFHSIDEEKWKQKGMKYTWDMKIDLRFTRQTIVSELPKILYKHRSWTKTKEKRILTDSEIYFASPDELDSLHECTLQKDYDCINDQMIWQF